MAFDDTGQPLSSLCHNRRPGVTAIRLRSWLRARLPLRLSPGVECDNQGLAMSDLRSSRPLILTLLLGVTACGLHPVPASPQRTTHLLRRPHRSTATMPTGSPTAAAVPSQSQSVPATSTAAARPDTAPLPNPTPLPDPTPLRVIGLSQPEVRQLLGPPTTSSTTGAAQAWTYQRADCSVEIAFYYDVTRSGFFALNTRLTQGGERQDCPVKIHDDHAS
jgi:hypothetical protein